MEFLEEQCMFIFYDIFSRDKCYRTPFNMIRIVIIQGSRLNKAAYLFFVWVNVTKCNLYTKRMQLLGKKAYQNTFCLYIIIATHSDLKYLDCEKNK